MKGQTLQEWAGTQRMFALVFTDIVDSTALANQLGDESWMELLLRHFAQARELMAQYDHHEIKIIGDSFMVVFRTAVDALDFVLAFHSETGDDRIKIRAGIHVGPARVIDDDIYGTMVNYTQRVESQAERPWIMISDETKRHIDYEKAARHSQLRFGGPRRVLFKGFDHPQTIWRVLYPRKTSNDDSQLPSFRVPEVPVARARPELELGPPQRSESEPRIVLHPRLKPKAGN